MNSSPIHHYLLGLRCWSTQRGLTSPALMQKGGSLALIVGKWQGLALGKEKIS
jgi:hypothetical protein